MCDAVAAAGAAHCEVAHFRRVQPFCNQLCIRRLKGRNPDEPRRVPPFGDAVADQGDSAHAVPPETGEFPGRKRGRLRDLRLRPVIDFKLVPGEEVPAVEADQAAAGPAGERIRSLRRKQHRAVRGRIQFLPFQTRRGRSGGARHLTAAGSPSQIRPRPELLAGGRIINPHHLRRRKRQRGMVPRREQHGFSLNQRHLRTSSTCFS